MPVPRLIHPVFVVIEPTDNASTRWDHAAKEQVPVLRRKTAITLQAQVHWDRQQATSRVDGGTVLQQRGFLVFLRRDVEAAAWVPAAGDRVSSIGGQTVDATLTSAGQQRGQYSSRHNLIRVEFEAAAPRHP